MEYDVTGMLKTATEEDFKIITDRFMEEFKDYLSKCGLTLNSSKCCIIVFRCEKKMETITREGYEEVWPDY